MKEIEQRMNRFTFVLNEERFESSIDRKSKCSRFKIVNDFLKRK